MMVYLYDANETTPTAGPIDIHDCFDASDDDQIEVCLEAQRDIAQYGKAYIGGGASPLIRFEEAR